jgi:hypothetical protein
LLENVDVPGAEREAACSSDETPKSSVLRRLAQLRRARAEEIATVRAIDWNGML